MAVDYDIKYQAQPAKLVMPSTMELISHDYGITHARLTANGMKVAIVPSGRGGSVMMRRIVEGGSRLENAETAGISHVLEHADFRSADWLSFGGSDKNASTSKLFIEHQAYMLLDPSTSHLKTELKFQRDTMDAVNLVGLSDLDIAREVNNVKDEGLFNGQRGSYVRNMIMKTEELLLPRVWDGGWVQPTIGLDQGQRISIGTSAELVKLHHQYRGPSRTTLVLAGPIDTNKSLQLASDIFADVKPNDNLLPIPLSRAPNASGAAMGNVSTNSGTRGISIGFLVPPYGPTTDTLSIMQHLVGMLGSQPALEQYGVSDVSMYLPQDKNASVMSILAKVSTDDPNEENAMRAAQHALQEYVIAPLREFSDDRTLAELVRQAVVTIQESLVSGPQEAAALAISGILATGEPAMQWHYLDRYKDITSARIRAVANRVFDPLQMAIVRATEHDGSVGLARRPSGDAYAMSMMGRARSRVLVQPAYTAQQFSAAHLSTMNPAWGYNPPVYSARAPSIMTVPDGPTIVSYNATMVPPASKKRITAVFGNTVRYGGWASAALVTAAMNAIAKASGAGAVAYKLAGNSITATVQLRAASPPGGPHYAQPLLKSVAMASAVARGFPGTEQMRATLPQQALKMAVESARDSYEDVTFQAQALTRSKMLMPSDPGYVPQDFGQAVEQLYDRHGDIVALLQLIPSTPPRLAGTNEKIDTLTTLSKMLLDVSKNSTPADTAVLRDIRHNADLTADAVVGGLRTFPFVAAVAARTKLKSAKDRVALILSNQVMVGGMGSVYTHNLREKGISYRPSGGVKLSWGAAPVLTLNATFDQVDRDTGAKLTSTMLDKWKSGDSEVFTKQNVDAAVLSIGQQVLLRSNDFAAIEYDLLARLDPTKLGADAFITELANVKDAMDNDTDYMGGVLRSYFSEGAVVASIVHAS